MDYLDPDKRAIGNALQIFFNDGSATERVLVNYPIGHRRRRDAGIPLLLEKFERNLATHFDPAQAEIIWNACSDQTELEAMPAGHFTSLWVK